MEAAIPISILTIGMARLFRRRSSLLENVLRRDYQVTEERADKLSGAWGRHPLLGRLYLPGYRAGTEKSPSCGDAIRTTVCSQFCTAASDWSPWLRWTRYCTAKSSRLTTDRAPAAPWQPIRIEIML
jgi:hypothetical protein